MVVILRYWIYDGGGFGKGEGLFVVGDSSISASPICTLALSRLNEPFREDISVVLSVRVDQEEHVGEA